MRNIHFSHDHECTELHCLHTEAVQLSRQYDDPHLHINSLWLAAATRTRTPSSRRRVCEASALDLISCRWTLPRCGRKAITANQQQSMGIQLLHLKGNRGALEAFMMLMRYKKSTFCLATYLLTFFTKLNVGSNS